MGCAIMGCAAIYNEIRITPVTIIIQDNRYKYGQKYSFITEAPLEEARKIIEDSETVEEAVEILREIGYTNTCTTTVREMELWRE